MDDPLAEQIARETARRIVAETAGRAWRDRGLHPGDVEPYVRAALLRYGEAVREEERERCGKCCCPGGERVPNHSGKWCVRCGYAIKESQP